MLRFYAKQRRWNNLITFFSNKKAQIPTFCEFFLLLLREIEFLLEIRHFDLMSLSLLRPLADFVQLFHHYCTTVLSLRPRRALEKILSLGRSARPEWLARYKETSKFPSKQRRSTRIGSTNRKK